MIPVNQPALGQRELEYVSECVRSGWVSSGAFITEFEERWASYCGRSYGVAVSNGTAALQLALASLDIGPGDEVILPTSTIISCALAVLYGGARPVLVDADPRTWCIDTTQLAAKITSRTKAIMPVHIFGHPVDMDPVLDLAEAHGLAVVEDAAEAHGASYASQREGKRIWHRCGSMGALSTFSFYANKLLTTGEGGMVVTDDPDLAEELRSLRNLCFGPAQRFRHERLGFNFRLTNMQAALGLAQLERFDEIVARKRAIADAYTQRLRNLGSLQLPIEEEWARSVYWMYAIVLDDHVAMDADEFGRRLRARQIETRPFFLGMHEQPVLQERGLFRGESYPIAERVARRGLYLPSGLALTDDQIEATCAAVEDVLS